MFTRRGARRYKSILVSRRPEEKEVYTAALFAIIFPTQAYVYSNLRAIIKSPCMFLRQSLIPGISSCRIILPGARICSNRKTGKGPRDSKTHIHWKMSDGIYEPDPAILPDPEPDDKTGTMIPDNSDRPDAPCYKQERGQHDHNGQFPFGP
jgi:hypothetical protein